MRKGLIAAAVVLVLCGGVFAQQKPDLETQWGLSGDVPVVGDFDGDGRKDITVFRPSTGQWFLLLSTKVYAVEKMVVKQWGAVGDIPLVGDYDMDGVDDLVVYRPVTGVWYIRMTTQFGAL